MVLGAVKRMSCASLTMSTSGVSILGGISEDPVVHGNPGICCGVKPAALWGSSGRGQGEGPVKV